ncbi:MAG TPA: type II secretion system F family protein [Ilumatobacteraceae bacterium]|nr:type II secretion system F family protein [Ilumatobacteraceae bacterium]
MTASHVVVIVLLVATIGGALRPVMIGPRRAIARPTTPRLFDPPTPANSMALLRHGRIAALMVGMVVGVIVLTPVPTAIVVGVFVLARRSRPILAARRRRHDVERALPDALDLLVLAIRTGLTPQQAIAELAVSAPKSVRSAFALTVHRCERGQSFADALTALPETLGPGAIGLADVIATSDRYGLPLGPVLDQLTTEARESRRRRDQADARKLPVRLSFPLVVCTLPSFVLLAIAPAVIAALSSLGGSAW